MAWKGELEDYLAWLATRHEKGEGRSVSERYQRYVKYLLTRLGEDLDPRSFKRLKKDDIVRWVSITRKGRRGRKLSEASVRSYMAMVKAFLRWVHNRKAPPWLDELNFGKQKSRLSSWDDVVDDDDLERVLATMPLDRRTALRLIRWSGSRPGEVTGIRRNDVKFDTKGGREFVILSFPKTKTDQPRTAIVSDPKTIETLKEYLAYAPESKWLFTAPKGKWYKDDKDRPLPSATLWRTVDRACERAGVKHFSLYDMRHAWATRDGSKLSSHLRSRQMGATIRTIEKQYDHIGPNELIEAHLAAGGGKEIIEEGAAEALKEFMGLILDQNIRMTEALGSVLPLEDLKRILPPEEKDRMMELATKLGGGD